jgi:hypothetical protein
MTSLPVAYFCDTLSIAVCSVFCLRGTLLSGTQGPYLHPREPPLIGRSMFQAVFIWVLRIQAPSKIPSLFQGPNYLYISYFFSAYLSFSLNCTNKPVAHIPCCSNSGIPTKYYFNVCWSSWSLLVKLRVAQFTLFCITAEVSSYTFSKFSLLSQ